MLKWITKTTERIRSISEHKLIEAAREGNAEAFGKLYLIYLDRIYRFIFFRVNCDQQLAEDLSQTVFYKAFQKITTFHMGNGQGTIQAWFYRIAQNCIYDHFRTRKQSISIELAEEVGKCDSVLDELIHEDKTKKLMAAISELNEEQKTVVTLRYIQDCSYEDIAIVVNKRPEAVRMIASRGVKKLQEILI